MRNLIVFFFALFFVLGAQAADIAKNIAKLNKTVTVVINGDTFRGGFVKADKDAAYFLVVDSFEEVKIRVSRASADGDYSVAVIYKDTLAEFTTPAKGSAKTYVAKAVDLKDMKSLDTDQGLGYWSTFKTTGKRSTLAVELKANLESSNSIAAPVTVTGTMRFSPCDGCEHSDQLIVRGKGISVNVISQNLGKYYEEDCGGTIQRLLSRLLEEDEIDDDYAPGLKVPFTYVGTIDANVGDYRDSIDDFWMAQKGELFIGTTNLTVPRFLDALVYQTAATLKVSAKDIWKDVLEQGKFTKFAKNVLTFVYQTVEIKTDLATGKSTVTKN